MMAALWLMFILAFSSASIEVTATCYSYPLVYNFYDMLAQSACTAKVSVSARVWAMRRSCPYGTKSCAQICAEKSLTCFQAYHVYKNPPILAENSNSQPDQGVPGLSMYSYDNGCDFSHPGCGPNYCCCSGPSNALG
ncbi:uncharacterized protein LOC135461259 [Liolophura sinensis]|uniref:uncharacterized protein LOC135461259 n=1 Tax=Liolophura sinensis TaxID=3198878 RepID=UPI003158B5F5